MRTSLADRLRAFGLRMLIATFLAALVCLYATDAVVPQSRLTTMVQIENTASIVEAPSTIGIADPGLYGQTQAQINQTLDTLQSIGVQDVRVFIPWIYVEPAQGVYNWSSIDMVIQAAQARNMGVMAEVASTPLWEGSSTAILGAGTPNPTDYASFVTQVAKRYGTAISAYDIWNQPNYVLFADPIDPVAYAALLKAAYPAIKAVNPSATVVAGALGSLITFGNITMDPTTFVQQMLAAGAANYFDALSFHPYHASLPFSQGLGVPYSPLTQLNTIHDLMTQYGDGLKKIWITEFGASTNDVSPQTQADLIKNLLDTWQTIAYAGPVFIYTAQDGVPGADGYGIWNADWTPKLAVAVVQQAIQQYSSSTAACDIGSIIGSIGSTIGSFVQTLTNAVQAIGQAIWSIFQRAGQTITAWFTAISSSLSGLLAAGAVAPTTPMAPAAVLKTTAITTKATIATTAVTHTTQTTGPTPTPMPAKVASTGTPGSAGTTGAKAKTAAAPTSAGADTPSGVAASRPATSTPPPPTVASGTTTSVDSKTTKTSETSSASGTNKAVDEPGATGVPRSMSGESTRRQGRLI